MRAVWPFRFRSEPDRLGLTECLAAQGTLSDQLVWMLRHRLVGVHELLAERELLSADLVTLCQSLGPQRGRIGSMQQTEERAVMSALQTAGVRALVLKGCLLAWSVYPSPEQRFRTDLDILVELEQVEKASAILEGLGYRTAVNASLGEHMNQVAWQRHEGNIRLAVDLHWGLRNHPALAGILHFDEMWEAAQSLDQLAPGARGLGPVHSLLLASMHWFASHARDRCTVWLLDKDLLWRVMTNAQRSEAVTLACQRGVAGLLGESLRLTRAMFATPVDTGVIEQLSQVGRDQYATSLIRASKRPLFAHWLAVRSEPGLRRKLARLRSMLLPPASLMHQLYPDGSRFGLPGLHVRRLWGRFRRSRPTARLR